MKSVKQFNLLDITPKTTFYECVDGKVVAFRFKELYIYNPYAQPLCKECYPTQPIIRGAKVYADGREVEEKYNAFGGMYPTAEDAKNKTNKLQFVIYNDDLITLFEQCHCEPMWVEHPYNIDFALWVWHTREMKAYMRKVTLIDLFNKKVYVEGWSGNRTPDKALKWYNTKEECKADNTIEVVDFPDTEHKEEPTDEFDVHIVFVGIVKNG